MSTPPLVVSGLLLLGAGLGWLALARPDGSYVTDVLPASLVAALGMSLAFVPSLGTAIGAARPEETGVASGLVSTSYQIGSAVGLAILTAVAAAFTEPALDAAALTSGYWAAFTGAATLAFIGAIVVAATLREAPAPHQATEVELTA